MRYQCYQLGYHLQFNDMLSEVQQDFPNPNTILQTPIGFQVPDGPPFRSTSNSVFRIDRVNERVELRNTSSRLAVFPKQSTSACVQPGKGSTPALLHAVLSAFQHTLGPKVTLNCCHVNNCFLVYAYYHCYKTRLLHSSNILFSIVFPRIFC